MGPRRGWWAGPALPLPLPLPLPMPLPMPLPLPLPMLRTVPLDLPDTRVLAHRMLEKGTV